MDEDQTPTLTSATDHELMDELLDRGCGAWALIHHAGAAEMAELVGRLDTGPAGEIFVDGMQVGVLNLSHRHGRSMADLIQVLRRGADG